MEKNKQKRVLYIGGVHHEGSSFSRYESLIKTCHEVSLLDTRPTHSIFGRLKSKFLRRLGLNWDKEIIQEVERRNPNIIWIDKPIMVSSKAIIEIKKKCSNAIIVGHITDDINKVKEYSPEIEKVLRQFDIVFSPNQLNIHEYTKINFIYNEIGYDDEMYRPLKVSSANAKTHLSFVGHYEPSYEIDLLKISDCIENTEFSLRIYGTGWWRAKIIKLRQNVMIRTGWQTLENVKNIYTNSVAGIGLYSELNRNVTSGRVFEIPALRTPLITKNNPIIHRYISGNYIGMDLCQNPVVFVETLRNNAYLEIMALNAIESMSTNKCTWKDRINECLNHIEKVI